MPCPFIRKLKEYFSPFLKSSANRVNRSDSSLPDKVLFSSYSKLFIVLLCCTFGISVIPFRSFTVIIFKQTSLLIYFPSKLQLFYSTISLAFILAWPEPHITLQENSNAIPCTPEPDSNVSLTASPFLIRYSALSNSLQ